MERYIRLSETLGEALRLPVHLLIRGTIHVGDALTKEDTPLLHDRKLTERLEQKVKTASLIPDRDRNSVYYGIARLAEDVCLVIGPCTLLPMEEKARHEYMTMHGMKDYLNYSIPVAPVTRIRAALILALGGRIDNDDIDDQVSRQKKPAENIAPSDRLVKEALRNAEDEKHHHSYRYERQIMDLLKEGNEEALETIFAQSDYSELGVMARSEEKQSEYLAVIVISLMARAAIEANVDPYRAYAINDLYLQKISESKDLREHRRVIETAIHELVGEIQGVRNLQRAIPHVERAKQFIRSNLNREITLAEISDAVGVSANYLSAIFRKQEGITMKEFILRERVGAAKILLRDTNMPVAHIAAVLHFSTHSHLSGAFRQQTGETPSEYRRRNQIIQEHG